MPFHNEADPQIGGAGYRFPHNLISPQMSRIRIECRINFSIIAQVFGGKIIVTDINSAYRSETHNDRASDKCS